MGSRAKAGELIVPGLVLVGCLLYWLHVQEARSVAQRVPLAVIVFTVAMTGLVVLRTVLGREGAAGGAEAAAGGGSRPADRPAFLRRALFVALCGGYYLAMSRLGFDLANLVFLLLAYPLAGLRLVWTVPAALASSAIFHVLARVMEFNVPSGPFGF